MAFSWSPCSRSRIDAPSAVSHSPALAAGGEPGHADQIAMPADFHFEDHKAAFFVEVRNAIDHAREFVGGLRRICRGNGYTKVELV